MSIKLLTHVAPDLAPIAALARRMGMQVETRTRNGRETLVLRVFLPDMAKPAQLLVETRGCKEGRCPLIQFLFVVRARGLTDAKISAWNLKSVSMFATRLKEDAVLLRRPVLVAGGVTEQNLQAELTMATRDIVGFLRAASEGGARKAQ